MSFVSLGTHIFGYETLQLLVYLSKLIMDRQYLSLTRVKSIRSHAKELLNSIKQ